MLIHNEVLGFTATNLASATQLKSSKLGINAPLFRYGRNGIQIYAVGISLYNNGTRPSITPTVELALSSQPVSQTFLSDVTEPFIEPLMFFYGLYTQLFEDVERSYKDSPFIIRSLYELYLTSYVYNLDSIAALSTTYKTIIRIFYDPIMEE